MNCTYTRLALVYHHVVSTNEPINIHMACNLVQSFKHLNLNTKRRDLYACMLPALFSHAYVLLSFTFQDPCGLMALRLDRIQGILKFLNQVIISTTLCLFFGLLQGAKDLSSEMPLQWSTSLSQFVVEHKSYRQDQFVDFGAGHSPNWIIERSFMFNIQAQRSFQCSQEARNSLVFVDKACHFFIEGNFSTGHLLDLRDLQEICRVLPSHEEHIYCNMSSFYNLVAKIHEIEN